MQEILIVDDNLAILKQISSMLEGKYEYTLAKSGNQALLICAQEPPDLILLDVEMPGMNGFETMTKLKENPSLNSIPVIFVTASWDTATEVAGFKLGARDFVKKPVVQSVLLHRLELHLKISSYQSTLADSVKTLADSLATSISDLIECRDCNTGGHVIRTSKFFKLLGRDLMQRKVFQGQILEDDLNMMVRAAPLHDVGKISISDTVLLKPGKLTDEEFKIMKTHSEIGATIVEQMYKRTPTQRYLKYANQIAFSHHERYDGKGYPAGLKAETIPLSGRIMAVADVYDAVASDRVYRKSLSPDEVFKIIVDGRGTQFDPYVVDSFINCHKKFLELTDSRPSVEDSFLNVSSPTLNRMPWLTTREAT
jgi:putative two-component system response regulator